MSRFIENAESSLDNVKSVAYLDERKLWMYLVSAIVWALLEIANAIRYSHE